MKKKRIKVFKNSATRFYLLLRKIIVARKKHLQASFSCLFKGHFRNVQSNNLFLQYLVDTVFQHKNICLIAVFLTTVRKKITYGENFI